MAERPYPSNMFAPHLGVRQPGMLPQGSQQPQVDSQQSVPGLNNPASDRMWQSIQNSQLQSQFTSQMGGDFPNPQPNQQQMLHDLLSRGRGFSQNQQVPQKHPQQPHFGLGGQMNHPHPFNDGQPPQNFSQQQLQAGLNSQMQQALAARNPAMVQGLASQSAARQLDLLVAQNQQNNQQSNPMSYALRQFQQPQPQQQPQTQQMQQVMGMPMQGGQMGQPQFSFTDGLQNTQPQPNGMQQSQMAAQQQQQQNQSRRPMTFQELRDRAQFVQSTIKNMEADLTQQLRSGRSQAEVMADTVNSRTVLNGRKQLLGKLFQAMQAMKTQGLDHVTMDNPNIPSSSPAPPQPPMPVQGNQQWLQRPGPSPANGFVAPQQQQPGPQHVPIRSPQVQTNQPAMQPTQRTILTPQIPARSGQTPLGMLPQAPQGSPRPPSMMANHQFSQPTATAAAAAGGANPAGPNPNTMVISRPPIQPLNAAVFSQAFQRWCSQHGIVKDENMLTFEGRPIELYALHSAVIRAGGAQRVQQNDQWAVIGGQLGFAQLPGNGPEPPRSGPQMAQRLAQVYEKYLYQFDMAYMRSLLHKAVKDAQQQQNPGQPQLVHNTPNQGMGQVNNGVPNNMQGGLGGMGVQQGQGNPLRAIAQLTGITDPTRLSEMVQYSVVPADMLRQRGVDPAMINMIELHRALLQRIFQANQNFREGLKGNAHAANPLAAAAGAMANQRHIAMATNGMTNQIMGGQPQNPQMGPNPSAMPNNQGMGIRPGPGQTTGMQGMNPGPGQMRVPPQPQQPHQQQVPPQQKVASTDGQAANGNARLIMTPKGRPSTEELQRAQQMVMNMQKEFQTRASGLSFRFIELPEHQRLAYNQTFEQLHRSALDVQNKLPIFACYMQEDMLRKLYTMLFSTFQQRSFLSAGTPRYFMSLDQIRGMCKSLQGAVERYNSLVSGNPPQHVPQLQPPQQQQPPTVPTQNIPPSVQPPAANPPHHTSPPSIQHHLQPPLRGVQPPSHSNHAPGPIAGSTPRSVHSTPVLTPSTIKKKGPLPSSSSPAATSTPPASAATPVNAPTPTHLAPSPRTPKSPKGRLPGPAKGKNQQKTARKGSMNRPAPAPPTPTAGPVTPSATSPTPGPAATPKPPTPASETGPKRKREEEATPAEPSRTAESPPKKIKTEPEEPMSEEQARRKQEADSIDSPEDALKFLANLTDLVKSQDTLPFEFTESLDNLIKVCGVPELPESMSLGEGSGEGNPSPQPNQASTGPDGFEFFDFSSFTGLDDDHESKATTPDLVPTSSTNPSPGSGSEPDATHASSSTVVDTAKIADPIKTEEDPFDPTRLGPFQDLDNGEASYYQDFSPWKWDGPMASADAPWAFLP